MKELTKAEEQIMQIVWANEKMFIKDIVEQMPDPKPAYNTVGTFIKLLEGTQGKGVVMAETRQAAESVIDAFREMNAKSVTKNKKYFGLGLGFW